jgi:hypothetical protein
MASWLSDEPENMTNRRTIVELAEKSQPPAIYPFTVYVENGGLMSYGVDYGNLGRRAADMANHTRSEGPVWVRNAPNGFGRRPFGFRRQKDSAMFIDRTRVSVPD